ncbi:hypothetical protein LENED_001045 [Lentinula edodes]|uniref:Uncharacterized protein n=1 Tax=Lentinula edodes TaxID=5353 RepID=A0A1Q3DX48_LENED|nr:hypothetical protein LENED_001045 [Lentinula edodes]
MALYSFWYFFEGVVPQDDESLNGKEGLAGIRLSPVFPTSSNMDQSAYQIECLYLYSEWNVCSVNEPSSNDSTTPGSFSSFQSDYFDIQFTSSPSGSASNNRMPMPILFKVLWALSLSTSSTNRPPPPFNMFHTCRLLTPPRSFSGPAWTHKVRFSNNCREALKDVSLKQRNFLSEPGPTFFHSALRTRPRVFIFSPQFWAFPPGICIPAGKVTLGIFDPFYNWLYKFNRHACEWYTPLIALSP